MEQLKSEPALAWKVTVNVHAARLPTRLPPARLPESTRNSALVGPCSPAGIPAGMLTASGPAPTGCCPSWPIWAARQARRALRPLMDETFDCWLGEAHNKHVRLISGRTRRCASQEAYAVWSRSNSDLPMTIPRNWYPACCAGSGRMAAGTATSARK